MGTHITFRRFVALLLIVLIGAPLPIIPKAHAIGTSEGNATGEQSGGSESKPASSQQTSKANYTSLQNGSASFSIPIGLPPGKGGVVPGIGLSYSSDQPLKSWVGSRWALNVGEVIRKGSSGSSVATFDDPALCVSPPCDRFALQFQAAVSDLTPKAGVANEFVTREEQFLKIVFKDGHFDSHWEVNTPDGSRHEFGNSDDSRIYRVGFSSGASNVRTWALNKVCSAEDYCMKFYYDKDATGGDFYLKRVEYTEGNGINVGRVVEFLREPRGAQSTMVDYSTGSKVEMDERLSQINVWAGANKLFAAYRLFYESNVLSSGAAVWDSPEIKLVRVEQYGTRGDSGPVADRWLFDYTRRLAGWGPDVWNNTTSLTVPFRFVEINRATGYVLDGGVRMADLNGDGRLDLIKSLETGAYNSGILDAAVQLRTATGWVDAPGLRPSLPFAGPTNPNQIPQLNLSGREDKNVLVTDFNGDGRPDLVNAGFTYYVDASGQKRLTSGEVCLNRETSWGCSHILEFASPTTDVLSPYTYFPPSPPVGHLELMNINGDECPDVAFQGYQYNVNSIVEIAPCDGASALNFSKHMLAFAPPLQKQTYLQIRLLNRVDVNGDGLTDVVDRVLPFYDYNLTNSWVPGDTQVSLGTGRGTVIDPRAVGLVALAGREPLAQAVDLNGDGFLDLVTNDSVQIHHQNLGLVTVGKNSGATRVVPTDLSVTVTQTQMSNELPPEPYEVERVYDNGCRFFDLNGDQLADIVCSSNEQHQIFLAQGDPAPGLLRQIKTGGGSTISFEYSPSTDSADTKMPFVKQVVSRVTVNDGRGHNYASNYSYSGGRYDAAEHQFRGFKTVVAIDPLGNQSETSFHQEAPLAGQVSKVVTKDANDRLFSIVKSYYTDVSTLADPSCSENIPEPQEPQKPYADDQIPYFNPVRRTITLDFGGDNDSDCRILKAESHIERDPATGFITMAVSQNFGQVNASAYGPATPPEKQTSAVSRFFSNSSKWLIQLPVESRLYPGIVNDDSGTNWLSSSVVSYEPDSARAFRTEARVNPPAGVRVAETQYDSQYHHPVVSIAGEGSMARRSYTYYDAKNIFPVRAMNMLGHSVETTYDEYGRVVSVKDANQIVAKTEYDELHRLKRTRVGLGSGATFDPESDSKVEYTNFCDQACLACTTRPDGSQDCPVAEPLLAPPSARTMASIDTDDCDAEPNKCAWSETQLDGLGRAFHSIRKGVESQSGQANPNFDVVTETEFDSVGRPNKACIPRYRYEPPLPDHLCTITAYDTAGRVTSVTVPHDEDGPVLQARTVYDDGKVTTFDFKNHQKESFHNGLGQLEWVKEFVAARESDPAQAHRVDYSYDILGNLVRVTDSARPAAPIIIDYDGFGQKTRMIDPDMGEWVYAYDSFGNLVYQRDAKGNETALIYDDLNRLIEKSANSVGDPALGISPTTHNYYFRYDNNIFGNRVGASVGKLVQQWSVDDGAMNFVEDFVYDLLGRMVDKETTIAGETVEFGYGYNNSGQVKLAVYEANTPAPEQVFYIYDDLGRLKQMVGDAIYVDDVNFDVAGRMTRLLTDVVPDTGTTESFMAGVVSDYGFPGIEATYRYNTAGDQRLQEAVSTNLSSHRRVLDFGYAYENNGNITDIDDRKSGQTKHYAYDTIDRLNLAIVTDVAAQVTETRTYEYDLLGNVLSVTGPYQPFMRPYAEGVALPALPPAPTPLATPTPIPALEAPQSLTVPETMIVSKTPAASPTSQRTMEFVVSSPNATSLTAPSLGFQCGMDNAPTFCSITQLSLPPSPPGSNVSVTFTNLSEGAHFFSVKACDNATGVCDPTPAYSSWIVDVTPPQVGFVVKPNLFSNQAPAHFELSATEFLSGFVCLLDNASIPCSGSFDISGLSQGAHSVVVQAIDLAGLSSSSIQYNWTVDTRKPQVEVREFPLAGLLDPPTAHFVFGSDEPGSTYKCITGHYVNNSFVDGAPVTCSEDSTFMYNLPGRYHVRVAAVDRAGNVGTYSGDYEFETISYSTMPPSSTGSTYYYSPTTGIVGGGGGLNSSRSDFGETPSTTYQDWPCSGLIQTQFVIDSFDRQNGLVGHVEYRGECHLGGDDRSLMGN